MPENDVPTPANGSMPNAQSSGASPDAAEPSGRVLIFPSHPDISYAEWNDVVAMCYQRGIRVSGPPGTDNDDLDCQKSTFLLNHLIADLALWEFGLSCEVEYALWGTLASLARKPVQSIRALAGVGAGNRRDAATALIIRELSARLCRACRMEPAAIRWLAMCARCACTASSSVGDTAVTPGTLKRHGLPDWPGASYAPTASEVIAGWDPALGRPRSGPRDAV
jgi:hypothetical protein